MKETSATKRRVEEEMAEIAARMPERVESDRITEIELLFSKESEWHSWLRLVVLRRMKYGA